MPWHGWQHWVPTGALILWQQNVMKVLPGRILCQAL
jgi:hypothetical protein